MLDKKAIFLVLGTNVLYAEAIRCGMYICASDARM